MGKNKSDDDIRRISGFPGIINKIVMFITYPLRRPLRCLLFILALIVIAYIIPILYGVKYTEVYQWYVRLFNDVNDQVTETVVVKGTDSLVDRDDSNFHELQRQVFAEEINNAPRRVDMLSEAASDVVSISETNAEMKEVMQPAAGTVSADVQNSQQNVAEKIQFGDEEVKYGEYSSLDYVKDVVEIEGEAEIHNANELSINNTYMFLYGIYSNPLTEKGVRCRELLKKAVKGNNVRCKIVAYTKNDKIATAICYVGEDEINSFLVEKGLSVKVMPR